MGVIPASVRHLVDRGGLALHAIARVKTASVPRGWGVLYVDRLTGRVRVSDPINGDRSIETSGGGTGDVVGPSSSVASEVALFDGTTGKLIKRASGTGCGS